MKRRVTDKRKLDMRRTGDLCQLPLDSSRLLSTRFFFFPFLSFATAGLGPVRFPSLFVRRPNRPCGANDMRGT